jgi:hypothetical protein
MIIIGFSGIGGAFCPNLKGSIAEAWIAGGGIVIAASSTCSQGPGEHSRHGRPGSSAAPSGQAPTPHSGEPKARGLTAKVRTETSSV